MALVQPKLRLDKSLQEYTPPPVTQPTSKLSSWTSPGVRMKPEECKRCPLSLMDHGFVPDEYPESPKIAVLLERPGQEEVLEQRPLWGRSGQLWMKKLVEACGNHRGDVLICNSLRCYNQQNQYPTGWLKKQAEGQCRRWDGWHRTPEEGRLQKGGLLKFDPNLFVATYHPAYILRVPAFYWLVLRAMEFAFQKAGEGYRPLVLMGDKALYLIAPWLERDERGRGSGGMKTWQRHWWEGSLKSGIPQG